MDLLAQFNQRKEIADADLGGLSYEELADLLRVVTDTLQDMNMRVVIVKRNSHTTGNHMPKKDYEKLIGEKTYVARLQQRVASFKGKKKREERRDIHCLMSAMKERLDSDLFKLVIQRATELGMKAS